MRNLSLVTALFAVSACASSFERPSNAVDMDTSGYQAQRQYLSGTTEMELGLDTRVRNGARCGGRSVAVGYGLAGNVP